MNIRQLRYFCAVEEFGSFSAAAEDQGVSVQAVSKALSELEDELGIQLFIRNNKGTVLTERGRDFFRRAHDAVEAFDQAESFSAHLHAADEQDMAHDRIRIALALPAFAGHRAVCSALERLISARTGTKVSLSVRLGQEALPLLQDGRLDAMITIGKYTDPSCVCTQIGTLPVCVAMSRNHPLAAREQVTFADLAPYPVSYGVVLDDFNETIVRLYRKHGLVSPIEIVRTDADVVDLLLVKDGYVLSVGVPLPRRGYCMRPFDPKDAIPVSVNLVTLKGSKTNRIDRLNHFWQRDFVKLIQLVSR